MQTYLVGGAVRDRLLGLPVSERDFVVVGSTPEEMRQLGFKQVGKDFPVFLHPQTHEEYALARTLRPGTENATPKAAYSDAKVTIEEDLSRRDLTINAIAERDDGLLVDPYGGQKDLRAKVLRHVSATFSEDPIRVLRVARFMARFSRLDFRVADETLGLMKKLAKSGALDNLVAERVWQALVTVLGDDEPTAFFETLRACHALGQILPEIDRLWGVPQPTKWHPEVDCGVHTMMCLRQSCELSSCPEVRFAALTHDLGKGNTPVELLPSHFGHEARGARLVRVLCERLRAPKRFLRLAEHGANFHGHCHRVDELKPKTILKVLEKLQAFRDPEGFAKFLLVCEADYRGRKGFEHRDYPQAERFKYYFQAARQVDSSHLRDLPQGKEVGLELHRLRLKAIRQAVLSLSSESVNNPKTGQIGADSRTQRAEEKNQQGA